MGVIYPKSFTRSATSRVSASARAEAVLEGCPAVLAFDRVRRANDAWSAHIPGEFGDARAVTELDDAYDAFFAARAQSVEGLSVQFEVLVALMDIEEGDSQTPGALNLVESMREAFEALGKPS